MSKLRGLRSLWLLYLLISKKMPALPLPSFFKSCYSVSLASFYFPRWFKPNWTDVLNWCAYFTLYTIPTMLTMNVCRRGSLNTPSSFRRVSSCLTALPGWVIPGWAPGTPLLKWLKYCCWTLFRLEALLSL